MARYPTFKEYKQSGKFKDGIKRCDELLKKHPQDVELLTTKFQLLSADKQDGKPVLEQLLSIEPPIQNLSELYTINDAVIESQRNAWPRPQTVGPEVSKLWERAVKAASSMTQKLETLFQRFECSVEANYMVDAQQALIQLKALQPKNRAMYMAHAAVTQLISTGEGDMQARLALMLAKKAVKEGFDKEDAELDCRVPGQIFALQGAKEDLQGIRGTRFAESKQVYEALRDPVKRNEANGSASTSELKDPSTVSSPEELVEQTNSLKARFSQLIKISASPNAFTSIATTAIHLFHTSIQSVPTARSRTKGEACFVAISALIKSWELSQQPGYLLISAHLAEVLLKLDPHIHEARLIIVYLFMRLGLGSLAIRYFDSLSIKEVQYDTIGHALFTDLSLTHPHQLSIGKKEERNPISRAKNAVQVYKRCEQKLVETEMSVLSNGQKGMIFDLHELRDSLRSSITKRIIFLEIRRQARLVLRDSSWHTNDLGPKCVANWLETKDNRDFAGTFDFEYKVEEALGGYHGRRPGRDWILQGLAADGAWCLASNKEADSPVEDPEVLVKELEGSLPDLGSLKVDDAEGDAGDHERLAADLTCQTLKVLLLLKIQLAPDDLKAPLNAISRAVEKLDIGNLCSTPDPLTTHLRTHTLYLDVLTTTAQTCTTVSNTESSKTCATELQSLQKAVQDGITALKNHAEAQRQRVRAASVRTEMARCGEELFEAVRALGEQDGVQDFCEAVEVAGKEGWEGVGRVKP